MPLMCAHRADRNLSGSLQLASVRMSLTQAQVGSSRLGQQVALVWSWKIRSACWSSGQASLPYAFVLQRQRDHTNTQVRESATATGHNNK